MLSSMNTCMWIRWASISAKPEEGGEMSLDIGPLSMSLDNVAMCAAITQNGVLYHHARLGPYNTDHIICFLDAVHCHGAMWRSTPRLRSLYKTPETISHWSAVSELDPFCRKHVTASYLVQTKRTTAQFLYIILHYNAFALVYFYKNKPIWFQSFFRVYCKSFKISLTITFDLVQKCP